MDMVKSTDGRAGVLGTDDAVRLRAAGARKMTADPAAGAEVLIWETEGAAAP